VTAAESSAAAILALPDPDWLYHHLTVEGPAAAMAEFRAAAAGPGLIPWALDEERMEENWLHLLLAPPPHRRTLSLEGARILAGQLREAVARQQARAAGLVGVSRACPLDLNALLPVPPELLRLGPEHPRALRWLWAEWGTTRALRHVRILPPRPRQPPGMLRLCFWSADWTPWPALLAMRQRWPLLRFEIRPVYDES